MRIPSWLGAEKPLHSEAVYIDRVFLDKASGKNIQGPQLEALLKFVREGDTVICHSMDRLGRNLVDLRRTVSELT